MDNPGTTNYNGGGNSDRRGGRFRRNYRSRNAETSQEQRRRNVRYYGTHRGRCYRCGASDHYIASCPLRWRDTDTREFYSSRTQENRPKSESHEGSPDANRALKPDNETITHDPNPEPPPETKRDNCPVSKEFALIDSRRLRTRLADGILGGYRNIGYDYFNPAIRSYYG